MEMRAVLSSLEHTFIYSELEYAQAGYIQEGYIQGTSAYIGICGVGPVLSGITCCAWLHQYPITCVIACGIAGAYSITRFPLSTVVFVTQDIYAEYGIRYGAHIDATTFPFFHNSTYAVRERITLPSPQEFIDSIGLRYEFCSEVTGITLAGISGDIATGETILATYPDGEIETMEGFSLAIACMQYHTPLLHLRSISNQVGIRSDWELESALATLSQTLSALWSKSWI